MKERLKEYEEIISHYAREKLSDTNNPVPAMSLVGHATDILKIFRNIIQAKHQQMDELRREKLRELLSQVFYQATCLCLQSNIPLESVINLSTEHVRQMILNKKKKSQQPVNPDHLHDNHHSE